MPLKKDNIVRDELQELWVVVVHSLLHHDDLVQDIQVELRAFRGDTGKGLGKCKGKGKGKDKG